MAVSKRLYSCQACGATFTKWSGQCNQCQAWDTIIEERRETKTFNRKGQAVTFTPLPGILEYIPRLSTAIEELDRALGGGLVVGSAILIGGDPGIGKSTLLLQMATQLVKQEIDCVYISGEESIHQIRLRAQRMGVENIPLQLAAITQVNDIVATLDTSPHPQVVIIDSIQTMTVEELGSAPGTIGQVRASAHELIQIAKKRDITLFLVGHVTKEGEIAGPKVLEHMVDTVLYFEGDRGHQYRILRAVKNRFGAANEIGVFSMQSKGLEPIPNPSSLFLPPNSEHTVSGSSIFAGIEGTRPVLVEIQALVAPSSMITPRRAVVGWDQNRLAMLLAVLQTRYGLAFTTKEVYLNVAGGLRIVEPAADLAVAVALISAFYDIALPSKTITFGEIGLSGEIRQVPKTEERIKEAVKLGFKRGFLPKLQQPMVGFESHELHHIKQLGQFLHQLEPA